MKVLILLTALVMCHYKPLQTRDVLTAVFRPCLRYLEKKLNAGHALQGGLAWALGVALPVLLLMLLHFVLMETNLLLAWLLGTLVLYFSMQFSRFCQDSERIAAALDDQNIDLARQRLQDWLQVDTRHLNSRQIAVVSIEHTLILTHYGLFGPMFWYALLGPAGAVLYRCSDLARRAWPVTGAQSTAEFGRVSQQVFAWLDWLPARISAGSFAVVGDFEDAAYCWRTQAQTWPQYEEGILLSSGAGALGVRLGEALPEKGVVLDRPDLGLGDPADADYLKGSIGLLWRSLILLIGMLILLTFASWLGHIG